jgi:hypothetical protein
MAQTVSRQPESSCVGGGIGVKNIMQISKLLPPICALVVCVNCVSLRAQDNPAQATARAALLEKMNTLDAADAQPPTNSVTLSGDNPAQAAARAALMEKMAELDATNTQPPAIIVTPSGATLEKPISPAIQTPPPAPTLPESQMASTDNESEMKANADEQKAALLAEGKKTAEAAAQAEAEAKAKAQQVAKAQKAAAKTGDLGLTPIEAPPLPISAAKQEQLQAILEKYKADQISPAEYQTQRAAILAQP